MLTAIAPWSSAIRLHRATPTATHPATTAVARLYTPAGITRQLEEGNVPSPRHPVVVSAAITDNGNRLLAVFRRDIDRWEAPGGYLERDETIDEGIRRTVWEGTGLLVRPVILTGVYKDMVRGEVALVFRCSLVGTEIDRHVEAATGRWVTADEVTTLMDDASSMRLLDALRLGPPKIRSPDSTSLTGD